MVEVWEVVAILKDEDNKRRVRIVRHAENGWFTFEEEYFSEEPREMAWVTVQANSFPICDTMEIAIREARGRISWLSHSKQAE